MSTIDGRIREIDGIRLLGVSVVVLLHALAYVLPDSGPSRAFSYVLRPSTYVALGSLFWASGVAISRTQPPLLTRHDVARFFTRRLARLYPLYLLALAVFVALWMRPISPLAIASHIGMFSVLLDPLAGETLLTMWFVQVVVFYYVCYVGFTFGEPSVRWILARMAFGLVVLGLWDAVFALGDYRLLVYYPAFCLGVLMGRRKIRANVQRILLYASAPIFALAVAGVNLSLTPDTSESHAFGMVVSVAGVPLAWALAHMLIHDEKTWRWVSAGAYASFCAYLFHRPILSIMKAIYDPATNPVAAYAYYWGAGLAAALFVGYWIQYAYDLLRSRRLASESTKAEAA